MSSTELEEEFEVLESIYPTELTKISDRQIVIHIEPDEQAEDQPPTDLSLEITYPDNYPQILPGMHITDANEVLTETDLSHLSQSLRDVGEENLGMAFTFTLVSHLKEEIVSMLRSRAEREKQEAIEVERRRLQAEEARTKGTPVTSESFTAWRDRFTKEMRTQANKADEEKLKGLSGREREETKKVALRLTGRQLFEKNRQLDDSDSTLVEEGAVSVDFSQFERDTRREEDVEETNLHLSDSDND